MKRLIAEYTPGSPRPWSLWVRETYKGEVISDTEREHFASQGDMIKRAREHPFKPPMEWQTKGAGGLFIGPSLKAEGTRGR